MTTGWDDGRSFEPMNGSYLALMRQEAIKAAVLRGVDIVLDNTNLSPRTVQEAKKFAGGQDSVEVVEFRVDWSECVRRNIARGEPISNSVINQMAQQYRHTYDWIQRGT